MIMLPACAARYIDGVTDNLILITLLVRLGMVASVASVLALVSTKASALRHPKRRIRSRCQKPNHTAKSSMQIMRLHKFQVGCAPLKKMTESTKAQSSGDCEVVVRAGIYDGVGDCQ